MNTDTKNTKVTKNTKTLAKSLRVLRVLRVALCCACIVLGRVSAQQPTAIDRAFTEFWEAEDPRGAERAAERILKAGIDFDSVYERLKAGRVYQKEKTGEVSMRF